MKRIISVFLVVILMVVWVSVIPAVAACEYSLEAQFRWYLREGRLFLDASCSRGDIEKYRWEIRDRDCEYLVEKGDGEIFRTSIEENHYGPGRYWVRLVVADRQGREDEITEKVTVRQKYQYRRRRWEYYREEIRLTREEKLWVLGIIFLVVVADIIKDNN